MLIAGKAGASRSPSPQDGAPVEGGRTGDPFEEAEQEEVQLLPSCLQQLSSTDEFNMDLQSASHSVHCTSSAWTLCVPIKCNTSDSKASCLIVLTIHNTKCCNMPSNSFRLFSASNLMHCISMSGGGRQSLTVHVQPQLPQVYMQ